MSETSGIKFRPVMGTEDTIKNTGQSNGWLYVATDSGNMYLDVDNHRISIGGAGGSSGAIGYSWANGDDSTIIKVEDEETGVVYYIIDIAAIEDGIMPKVNSLILNSDGRFFRVSEIDSQGQIIANLIAVSGSGGGGGGQVSTDDLSITVDSSTLARGFTLVAGKDYYVSVTGTSTIDEDVYLYFTFTGADGYRATKTVMDAKSGEPYLFNLNFLPVNENLTMRVEVDSDNTKMKTLPGRTVSGFKTVEMGIQKPQNVNTASVYTGSANIDYFLTGDPLLEETLHVFIDGIEDVDLQKSERVSSNTKTVTIPRQSHGMHVITLSVSTVIQDNDVYSNEVSYEVAWSDPEDQTPIIWTADYADTVILYEPFVIKYQVYDPATSGSATNDPFTVYVQKSGVRVAEISKKYTAGSWLTLDLTELYELGDNNFALVCGTTSKAITFNVTDKGSKDLSIQPADNLVMNLSATGRSNDEIMATRSVWKNGAYNVEFNNFNWYNNGWGNDDDGNGAYLSVANNASVRIPFRDFASNPIEDFQFNGSNKNYTLEIRFRVKNVQEYSTLVTTNPYYYVYVDGVRQENGLPINEIKTRQANNEDIVIVTDDDGNWVMDQKLTEKIVKTEEGVCFRLLNQNNYGLCVGTQEAYFRSPEGTTNVRYKEDEVINFSVVVSNKDKLASIYLNGILSGSLNLGADSSFYCGDTIEISSRYCDIDIYKIRFFNTGLTMPQVIHNYISDIHDLTLYDQNDLAKAEGEGTLLSYTKLINYNQKMLEEDNIDALTMPYALIEIIDNATGMIDPNKSSHNTSDDLLPWKKGNNRYCKITFVNPVLDALYDKGEITDSAYKSHSPSYVCIGADINVQGTSSQGYPRRNYKTKMKSASGQKDANKTKHNDWGWFYTGGPYKADWQVWLTGNDAEGNPVSEEDRLAARDRCRFSKWKQDNAVVGTNKYTWKIDYMESSGSYNTGFANLVGNNIYNAHPLAYYNIPGLDTTGLRTSVYGFPVLTFHQHSKPEDIAKIGTPLQDEIYEYIGRYNINQDKGSNELYGFSLEDFEQPYVTLQKTVHNDDTGEDEVVSYHPTIADVAECWEMTDNQGTWTSFSYPSDAQESHFSTYTIDSYDDQHNLKENPRLEVIRHYECRYHKDADFIEVIASDEKPYDLATVNDKINDPEVKESEKEVWRSIDTIPKMNQYIIDRWSNWEAFVNWCDSTDRRKADATRDITPVEYEVATEPKDMTGVTMRYDGDLKYATFTKDTAAYRLQKFKSEFTKHLNLEYCTVYFVMTELLLCYDSRGKNMMMASYGPTADSDGNYVWFPIFYDIDTQLGLNNIGATLWDYNCDATQEQAFSTPSSVLWVNFLDAFEDNIKNKYASLRSDGKLSYETIDGAYLCDPNVFDSYAMRGIRPIIAIGLDEYYKYVAPSKTGYYNTSGQLKYDNNSYAYAVNGDRMLSRELLLRNRLNYIDSYWVAGDYTPAVILMGGVRMRANANNQGTSDKYLDSVSLNNTLPANAWPNEELAAYPVAHYDATPKFSITPFLSQYVFTYNDKQASGAPVKYQGTPVETECADSVVDGYKMTPGFPEQIVVVPAEDYISSLGDLSLKYLSQFTVNGGKRFLDLDIGSDAPGYFNSLLGVGIGQFNINDSKYVTAEGGITKLNPSRKTLLKRINLTNVTSLQEALDVSGSEKLQECRALGSQIQYVSFAEGAPLDCVHLPRSVTRIDLIEATGLTKILTQPPVVWGQDRDSYTGLYIEDLTDNLETIPNTSRTEGTVYFRTDQQGNRINNSIQRINIVGGKLGYDSYVLLDKAIKIKDEEGGAGLRLQINLENVEWSPYLVVESGTPYNELTTYYKLTDHSTFTNYTFTTNAQWQLDTLNGLIFTYNDNPKKNLITSTALLDKFIADYEAASAANPPRSHYTNLTSTLGYPYLTGTMYIDNADVQYDAIDEADITEKYGAIWSNLKIYAAKVNEAYVAKFVQRTESGQDKQVDIKRYSQEGTVHPELTSIAPLYPNYDFKGWSLNPDHSILEQDEVDELIAQGQLITNANVGELTFSAQQDVYTFYAVFVPHPFVITFDMGNNQLTTTYTPFNHTIILPANVPYKDESGLPLNRKYAFLGYAKTSTATKAIDMSKEKALKDTKYYAVFTEADVHSNPLDPMYLIFSNPSLYETKDGQQQIMGVEIGLNTNYVLRGKITLPTTYTVPGTNTTYPIVAILDASNGDNGFKSENGGRNHITHIFWDDPENAQLFRIWSYALAYTPSLQYFEMPPSCFLIANFAFAGSACPAYERLEHVVEIGQGAFNENIGTVTDAQIYNVDGDAIKLGSYAFAYMPNLTTITLGASGYPAHIILMAEQSLAPRYGAPVRYIVYATNPSDPIWSNIAFGEASNMSFETP